MEILLEVDDLHTYFETAQGVIRAVNGVDIKIRKGRTIGIVGESGSGKTVLALSILRLVNFISGNIVKGEILFDGCDLLSLSDEQMRKIRGREISMIFQEPMTSLNPVFRIGEQLAEVVRLHRGLSRKEAVSYSIEMLRRVGIPSPEKRIRDYPHQMSGGMRQRVMIAMAMACHPRLLLADEPTTALDVTIQAQIIELIQQLQNETGTSVALITHDFGVVAQTAHEVVVMYAGQIVEQGPTLDILGKPEHPYTITLIESIPTLEKPPISKRTIMNNTIDDRYTPVKRGCVFQHRCSHVFSKCREYDPTLISLQKYHFVRCWKVFS